MNDDAMMIGPMDGMVILRFREPMEQVAFPPDMALEVAESFASAAFEARDGTKPVGDALKAELVEKNRMIATQRVASMLNSLRENRRVSNGSCVQQIVDQIFKVVY